MFSAARYAGRADDRRETMPGGIGPVSDATISACSRRDRAVTPARNANEIFFNLDNRRVFYDSTQCWLYFVDSPDGVVLKTVRAAFIGLNATAEIEQVYLDPHRCFNGARRVRLVAEHADTLLVALRLAGIRAASR